MALRLAAEKCKIAVVDIERDAANRTVTEITENHGIAVAYCVSTFFKKTFRHSSKGFFVSTINLNKICCSF